MAGAAPVGEEAGGAAATREGPARASPPGTSSASIVVALRFFRGLPASGSAVAHFPDFLYHTLQFPRRTRLAHRRPPLLHIRPQALPALLAAVVALRAGPLWKTVRPVWKSEGSPLTHPGARRAPFSRAISCPPQALASRAAAAAFFRSCAAASALASATFTASNYFPLHRLTSVSRRSVTMRPALTMLCFWAQASASQAFFIRRSSSCLF